VETLKVEETKGEQTAKDSIASMEASKHTEAKGEQTAKDDLNGVEIPKSKAVHGEKMANYTLDSAKAVHNVEETKGGAAMTSELLEKSGGG